MHVKSKRQEKSGKVSVTAHHCECEWVTKQMKPVYTIGHYSTGQECEIKKKEGKKIIQIAERIEMTVEF